MNRYLDYLWMLSRRQD